MADTNEFQTPANLVFGESRIYIIAGRRQAIAMNGWAPQINPAALWNRT